MIFSLFRQPYKSTINALYGAIVAQARLPVFYEGYGVPDTVEGRFDMIVLHVILVSRRLRSLAQGRDTGAQVAKALFAAFCRAMARTLREMGVGDLTVPKKVKGLAEAYYGRQGVYEAALPAADPADLVAALARNVFSAGAGHAGSAPLAAYARRSAAALDLLDDARLTQGLLAFADPATILAENRGHAPEPEIEA